MSEDQVTEESVTEVVAIEAVEAAAEEPRAELDAAEKVALIEALIFTHGDPLSLDVLAEISGLNEMEVREAINQIRSQLTERGSGIELLEVAGKFQFRTRQDFSAYVRELKAGRPRRLSGPALETLAVIAYRQPIVRSDMEKIRGVDVTPTLKTLLDRKLIRIVGHQETVGQPALYGTTDDFLKVFGLSSLSQLPTLRDLKELDADPGESAEETDLDESEEKPVEEAISQ
ncbi:MAG: SMC-Scp complex subunit ScpB [Deltaproteobacteria bacterium]|nr:SMC-Scp complex subunit ScpB [Deltaproteobacteria bacterium]